MIAKPVKGDLQWLFPSSFLYIIEHQEPSGGWSADSAQIDGILSTLAALLALCEHRASPLQLPEFSSELDDRISKATKFLRQRLNEWDVEATLHVGFEILVPSLLEQLELHDISLCFAKRGVLLDIRDQKLSHFDLSVLYGTKPVTALHSLEAFATFPDMKFDRVAHHKTCGGSLMASPSSTAAYLMNCSTWDCESEDYLRHVIAAGQGKGSGSVPSAFPSTLFEMAWVRTLF
jgi:hypothetical protein